MRPRSAALFFFVAVFSVAAVYLLYEGVTTGNYLLVAGVLAAYAFALTLEASLSLGRRRTQPKQAR